MSAQAASSSRIIIVGPGAIGTLFGALLARGGHDPFLLDHCPTRAAARNQNGIRVSDGGETWCVPINSATDVTDREPAGIVFICTKSYDTAAAVAAVTPSIGPDTIVVSLQNGMGNVEDILPVAPRHCVCAATSMGAYLSPPCDSPAPHTLHWAGHGITQLAAFTDTQSDDAETVAAILKSCNCECEVVEDAQSMLWSKLIINAAINPITAIRGITNGALLESTSALELAFAAAVEACAVADKLGIGLTYEDVTDAIANVCRRTSNNESSMLQDMRRGRQTEIESISGTILAEANRLDIPVPVNQSLYSAIQKRVTENTSGKTP
jgi:2-dehydropantoate 2-reductase